MLPLPSPSTRDSDIVVSKPIKKQKIEEEETRGDREGRGRGDMKGRYEGPRETREIICSFNEVRPCSKTTLGSRHLIKVSIE